MLAPLVLAIHAGEFALLALLVRALHAQAHWPWLAGAALAILVALAWRGLLILATMALSGARPLRARLWLAETAAFARAYLAMSVEPLRAAWRRRARRRAAVRATGPAAAPCAPGATEAGLQPVLIHGWFCNGGAWVALLRRLARAPRWPEPIVVSLSPLLGDIDRMVESLAAAIETSGARTDARLVLVAHSMGGLVARRYLQRYGARRRVAGLCTIGSPHRGSALARWARGRAAAQMRPGNAWLSALPLPAATLPTLSIWSDADNFVAPADSSRLDGARNLQLAGRGHFELLRDAEVHRAVEGFLTGLAAGIRPLDAAPVRVAPAA